MDHDEIRAWLSTSRLLAGPSRVANVPVDAKVVLDDGAATPALCFLIRDHNLEPLRLPAAEIRRAGVQDRPDVSPRREELNVLEERKRRDLSISSQARNRLVKGDRDVMNRA